MKLTEDVKPVAYLERHAARLVQDVVDNGRTVMLTADGEARAVLMDIARYEKWRSALQMMKILAQGEADHAAGRVVPQDEAFERAERLLASLRS
jgi:PHD/YefM family antitoxin component YafN of YafNO toxin-antitoxin module